MERYRSDRTRVQFRVYHPFSVSVSPGSLMSLYIDLILAILDNKSNSFAGNVISLEVLL